jgi:hypothetical protein
MLQPYSLSCSIVNKSKARFLETPCNKQRLNILKNLCFEVYRFLVFHTIWFLKTSFKNNFVLLHVNLARPTSENSFF